MRSATFDRHLLLQLREDAGLTQSKLGELASEELGRPVTKSQISRYECGHRSPRPDTYRALCDALGVGHDTLRIRNERPKNATKKAKRSDPEPAVA